MGLGDTVEKQLYRDVIALMSTVNNWDDTVTNEALKYVSKANIVTNNDEQTQSSI